MRISDWSSDVCSSDLVLTGLVGGDAIGLVITGWLQDVLPAAGEYARPIGIGTAVGLITAAQVIFGELIPKRLALTNAEGIASVVAIPLDMLARIARPIVATLRPINRLVPRPPGIRDDARNTLPRTAERRVGTR